MGRMGHIVPEIVVPFPLPVWSVIDHLMKKQRLPLVQAMSCLVGCVPGSKALLLLVVNSLTLSSAKKFRVRATFNISLSCVGKWESLGPEVSWSLKTLGASDG